MRTAAVVIASLRNRYVSFRWFFGNHAAASVELPGEISFLSNGRRWTTQKEEQRAAIGIRSWGR